MLSARFSYCTIGTFNLDFWSSHRNLEVNLTTLDPHTATQLEHQFMKDVEISQEITLEQIGNRSIWQRLVHWGAFLICRGSAMLPFWPED
jgi:phosphatidylserine/phosphatidylglycerophosphate/cardiolipin synthase-like enzyme